MLFKRHHLDSDISIHALREEGDPEQLVQPPEQLPISIHALREEGDRGTETGIAGRIISIHALREEGDLCSSVSHT